MKAHNSTAFESLTGREIVERRTANAKHFDLGQGRRQAVIFASPVHYKNAKGAWEEIDNRLVEKTDAKGRRRLETKAGQFRARFFEDANGESLASMKSGGTEFAWTYPGAASVKPVHVKKALRRSFDTELSRRMKVTDRLHDDVTYESLFPGMSVRLTADELGVKEDIILENKAALRHAVLKLPQAFEYVKNADESVSVLKNGEIKLTISAPFTYDANMTPIPTRVSLTAADSAALLRYEIDENDLENAVFPVTIDPRVSFSGMGDHIKTTQINDRNKDTNYSTSSQLTSGSSSGTNATNYITLVQFDKLMNKKASDTILSAELNVKISGYQGNTGNADAVEYVGAYEIKAPWDAATATWNSMQADTFNILDDRLISFISHTNVTYAKFNITDLYNKWYLPDENGNSRCFGVALRKPIGTATSDYVTFYSSNASGHTPFMVVDYLSHAGVKGWWTYDTLSCGRAGSANVDLFNGNLVVHHADTSTIGSRMPVSVKHIYNSCQSLSDDFGCGLGWRTSLHQIVRQETVASDTYYIWQDGEGTDHFFKKTSAQPYSDSEGMQLKMNLTDSGLTITDKGDTVMAFEKIGADDFPCRLKTVTDPHGNRMELVYDESGKLIKTKDGIDRETVFAYNANGLLSSITAPGCPVVQYVYASVSGGYNLHKVNYADLSSNQYTEYAYEGSMLTNMKNFDGCELVLSYEALCSGYVDGYTLQSRRVKDIEFKNGDVKGTKKLFTYGHMRTDVTIMENEVDGKKMTYHFNSSGNVVDINDEMWYTNGTKYDSGIENTPSSQGRVRRAVVNRLVNADFSSGWTQTKEYGSDTYALDSSVTCLAMKSAKVVKKGAGEFKSTSQAKLFKSGKYTFSAYVKTTGLTVPDGKKGAFLRVTVGDNVYESEPVVSSTAAREMNTFAGGWERMYVTFPFTRPEGMDAITPSSVTVAIVCDASKGTAYFAAPQVESGEIANMFNLVVNGDFSVTKNNTSCSDGTRLFPENWTTLGTGLTDKMVLNMQTGVVTDRAENKMPETVEGNALRLFSFPTVSNIYMSQTIRTYGNKNDVFVLGGWVNSHTVQAGYTLSKPTIRVRFLKAADSQWTSWNNLFFTTENDNWHHMTTTIAAPYAYARIEVSVSYPQNNKTCMFSQIYLYRDLYGSSFGYDDNGNVVSIKDLSNQQSQASYDSFNNLLSYVQPGSASTEKYSFTYGDTDAEKKRHLQLSATTPMGVKSATTYDQYGNSTANVVQPAEDAPLMKAETEYTNNGNYVVAQKDARGNSTSNFVDINGKVLFVTDPVGNSIHYGYDTSNRVTSVIFEKDDPDNSFQVIDYKNEYEYTDDRLTKISHNTTGNDCDVHYTLEYDNLGRKTVVKVGNQELSRNVYSNDRKGLLEEINFGNGAKVRYDYDDFGRTTAIYVDEPGETTTTPKYEFKYDARGIASVIKDNIQMTETRVTSDLADRPSESVTRDTNGNPVHKSMVNYDGKNRIKEFIDILPDSTHKTAYTYDADERVTEVKFDDTDTHKVNLTYDLLNRVTNRTVTNGVPYSTTYGYLDGDTASYGANATTSLIETITQGSGENAMNFAYTYDSRGNITSEARNGVTVSYEYDELGQLIRVNDPNDTTAGASGTTWVYTYDRGGNILNKSAYGYTTSEVSSPVNQWTYAYEDSNWKDKLTKFNGVSITYDAIGNPLSDGTWTYTWEKGRQLKSMHNASTGVTMEFKYNAKGIRTKKIKKVNGIVAETTNYILSGKKLIALTKNTDSLYFTYDAQNQPLTVDFNGQVYTYVKNLQGDIVGIVDGNGTIIAEYKYNAWGQCIYSSNDITGLASLNPYRYRHYLYDIETDMYMLYTRYYCPIINRFINADNYPKHVRGPITTNLFTYCRNVPVMALDSKGTDLMYITNTEGAHGFGHTSLIIQDELGDWYYFYYGMKNDDDTKKMLLAQDIEACIIYEKINIGEVDPSTSDFFTNAQSAIDDLHKQNNMTDQNYDRILYFSGDYTNSHKSALAQAANSANETYNLYTDNCVINSMEHFTASDPNAKVALVSENLGVGFFAGMITLHIWFFLLIGAAASVVPNTVHNNMELYHSMKY